MSINSISSPYSTVAGSDEAKLESSESTLVKASKAFLAYLEGTPDSVKDPKTLEDLAARLQEASMRYIQPHIDSRASTSIMTPVEEGAASGGGSPVRFARTSKGDRSPFSTGTVSLSSSKPNAISFAREIEAHFMMLATTSHFGKEEVSLASQELQTIEKLSKLASLEKKVKQQRYSLTDLNDLHRALMNMAGCFMVNRSISHELFQPFIEMFFASYERKDEIVETKPPQQLALELVEEVIHHSFSTEANKDRLIATLPKLLDVDKATFFNFFETEAKPYEFLIMPLLLQIRESNTRA